MTFISYAQNYEYVELWRALKQPDKGFQVDLGTNDPYIAQYQKKCQDRFREIQAGGTTIIIVSHSLAAIEYLFDRTFWLAERKAVRIDDALDVVSAYQASQIT